MASGINVAELKGKIFEIVKNEGPVIPSQVSAKVAANIMFTSALLSELIADGKVKYTHAKLGGSPMYYVTGQEEKLQMLHSKLGDKPGKAFAILREKQVLRDSLCEPWLRVALREIKDFAKMLTVSHHSVEEVFWKWYLTPDDEAKEIVSELLRKDYPDAKKEEEEAPEEKPAEKEAVPLPEKVAEAPKRRERKRKEVPQSPPEKPALPEEGIKDAFYDELMEYFKPKSIRVLEKRLVKKNSEMDFVAEVPSELGELRFFIKAKKKKSVSEADIAMAYSEGHSRRLPVIFLSTGEPSKKVLASVESKFKGMVTVRKI